MTLLLDIVAVVALLGLCYLVIEHFRLPKDTYRRLRDFAKADETAEGTDAGSGYAE